MMKTTGDVVEMAETLAKAAHSRALRAGARAAQRGASAAERAYLVSAPNKLAAMHAGHAADEAWISFEKSDAALYSDD
jgi:hypothetical protein